MIKCFIKALKDSSALICSCIESVERLNMYLKKTGRGMKKRVWNEKREYEKNYKQGL